MGVDEDGYYSLRDILGYGAKYNIVLSDRGRGKSWAAKWFLMNQEGTFMCVYRTGGDMASAVNRWLDPITKGDKKNKKISADAFSWTGDGVTGRELVYNGEVKGFFRCLTQVNKVKQEVFPDDLNWIWWDEFIPLVYKKLPGVTSEGDALRAIVKTIEHDTVNSRESKGLKPLRVLMFGNPFTWDNPVLSYFRVLPKYGIYRAGPGIVCEQLSPFVPVKNDTKMTVDEFLGNEINTNQGWADQTSFVGRPPKGATPVRSLRFENKFFVMYAGEKAPPYFILGRGSHMCIEPSGEGRMFGTRWGTIGGLREDEYCMEERQVESLRRLARDGDLRYADMNVKFDFLNAIWRKVG